MLEQSLHSEPKKGRHLISPKPLLARHGEDGNLGKRLSKDRESWSIWCLMGP